MPVKDKIPKSIPLPQTAGDAWSSIAGGVVYFLITHTKKTIFVIMVIAGFSLYFFINYVQLDPSGIIKLKPAEPVAAAPINHHFSIMPEAFAETPGGEPITINGKVYGYKDSEFELWKLAGQNSILVHDKVSGAIVVIEMPALQREKMKQYAK